MKKLNEIKKNKFLFYGIVFFILALLCFLFPYTHDDWAWGTEVGIQRLTTFFADYNGRYLGNLFILALSRNILLKSVVMALVYVGILFLANELTEQNKLNKWLSLFLFLVTPRLVFRQVISWASGFTNYVLPVIFILLYFYSNRDLFLGKFEENSKIKIFLYLLLGIGSCLFIEHVTLYLIVLSLGTLLYKYIKFKKVSLYSVGYAVGCIIGSIFMFSNGAYSSIFAGDDTLGYRQIGLAHFISNSIKSFFDTIYTDLVFNNYILNIILSICIITYLYNYLKKNKKDKKVTKLVNTCTIIISSFTIYSLIYGLSGAKIFLRYTKYVNGCFSIVYFLAILGSTLLIQDLAKKRRLLLYLFSIVMLTIPLFVVSPIGSRCFFPMYVMWILVALEFFSSIIKNKEFPPLKFVLLSGIVTVFVYLFLIYGYVFKINVQRYDYIKDHNDEEKLVLPKLPYSTFLFHSNPYPGQWLDRFKLFYDIPEDTEVEFVDWKDFKKMQ